MAMTLETFREEVERLRAAARPGPPKYPQEMKDFAVQYVRTMGKTNLHAAKDLGVSATTLYGWMHARNRSAGRLRPVTVVEEQNPAPSATPIEEPPETRPSSALTLTTAQGHRVDGLSMEQAVALLRGLQ